jgi:two-component system, LytTR family, response regulator
MTLRALVVDDEPLARKALLRLLKNEPDINVIGQCSDGEAAVEAIRRINPDLVFLDVQMPEMDGFQVVDSVGAERMPVTIFVTAYDKYALEAFDANAVDYLLKPFAPDRLARALRRARDRCLGRQDKDAAQRLFSLLDRSRWQTDYAQRLAVSVRGRILFVSVAEIDWIGAEGNYAALHVSRKTYDVRETMQVLIDKLDPRDFVRIHRSTIVNVHRVSEIRPWFQGSHIVLLRSGEELRMSRYQHEAVQRLMGSRT